MKNKKALILLLVIIALCLAVIYYFKNADKKIENLAGGQSDSTNKKTEEIFRFNETKPINYESLKKEGYPIIIDYGAEECGPCKQMKEALVKAHQDYKGKAIIKFLDIWENPEVAAGMPFLEYIPTQVFINSDGSAYKPSDEIKSKLEFRFYRHDGDGKEFTVHTGVLTTDDFAKIIEDMK